MTTYMVTLWKSERGYCPCVEKEIHLKFDPELAKQRLIDAMLEKPPNMFVQFLASIILRYKI
jgi:hypothetical protein